MTLCPAMNRVLGGTQPQGSDPKAGPTLDDPLMNCWISRTLLQLCPLASHMLPLASTTRNTAQVLSLPYRPSGEPGTP